MERSLNLLSTTALPMDEVAEQAGFASVHYMCRVFKQLMGVTPTEYRRRTDHH